MHPILLTNLLILTHTCLNSNQALLKLGDLSRTQNFIMATYNGLGVSTKPPCLACPKSTLCFLLLLHTGCSQTPTNQINHHICLFLFLLCFYLFQRCSSKYKRDSSLQRWLLCCCAPCHRACGIHAVLWATFLNQWQDQHTRQMDYFARFRYCRDIVLLCNKGLTFSIFLHQQILVVTCKLRRKNSHSFPCKITNREYLLRTEK